MSCTYCLLYTCDWIYRNMYYIRWCLFIECSGDSSCSEISWISYSLDDTDSVHGQRPLILIVIMTIIVIMIIIVMMTIIVIMIIIVIMMRIIMVIIMTRMIMRKRIWKKKRETASWSIVSSRVWYKNRKIFWKFLIMLFFKNMLFRVC